MPHKTLSVPALCAGNDFSTLYAPLIRDGRMDKYYCECANQLGFGVSVELFPSLCFHVLHGLAKSDASRCSTNKGMSISAATTVLLLKPLLPLIYPSFLDIFP